MKFGLRGKAYLSAILDLADKSIVSFKIGRSNNNELVFKTLDIAHKQHPDAKSIFHSDFGYQYTAKKFNTYNELETVIIDYIEYYNNHRYQKRL